MQKGKIVELRRKYGFIDEANADPQVKEYLDMAYIAVGSYWKIFGKVHASGLTREEENILMPEVLGIYPGDDKKTFRQAVESYFANMNTRVPAEGLKLQVGLEKPGDPLSDSNIPINVTHYIAWKHAKGHMQVGADLNEAERYGHKKFYLVDKEAQVKASGKLLKLENNATAEYLNIETDPMKVDFALTVLGYNLNNYAIAERSGLLKKQSIVDSTLSNEVNEKRLTKFIDTVRDKHLKLKYDILNMISGDKLTRVGNRILLTESQTVIGNDLAETVLWFLDKKNSATVNALYVQMQEIGLKQTVKPEIAKKPTAAATKETAPIVKSAEAPALGDIDDFNDSSDTDLDIK